MVSKAFLIAVAIVATIVGSKIANEFFVGDDYGWELGIDYQAWAAGKEFYVGDKLGTYVKFLEPRSILIAILIFNRIFSLT